MKKISLRLAALVMALALAVLLAGCGGQKETPKAGNAPAKLSKVRLTLTPWPGYGPLFLAKEKGFFKEEGLEDVEISVIAGLAERKQALAGNKVDGMATTLDIEATLESAGIPMKIIWALDDSFGGDGILAKNSIKSVADLKGKTVAFDVGTTSHIFLLSVLDKAGLSDKDVVVTPMTAGDAGAAFVAGKVDAAVTWEPWLGKGVKEGNGHLIATSKDTPGLITDAVAFRKDFADSHPKEMQAMVNGLNKAMKYWKEHQAESNKIMAAGMQMKEDEFNEGMAGIKLYDLQDNIAFFGTSEKPGKIYDTLNKAADFYFEKKKIDKKPDIKAMVDGSYLSKVPK